MTFDEIVQRRLSRRDVMRGGLMTAGLTLLGPLGRAPGAAAQGSRSALLGFAGIPTSKADTIVVPAGYVAEVLYAWGDPVSDGPTFKPDASSTVDEQARQAGMHHDGIEFFPLPLGSSASDARPARDEPRVHGRRPPASRGHGAVDGREGARRPRPPTASR